MIDLNNLYEQFNSMYNVSQAGFFRPDRDFVPAVHAESLNIFNILGSKLQKSQRVMDMMSPFLKPMNISILKTPSIDYFPTPSDYCWYSDSRILVEKERVCGLKDCDLLQNGECLPSADIDPAFFNTTSEFENIPVRIIMNSKWNDVTTHPNRGPKMGEDIESTRVYCTQTTIKDKQAFEILPKGIGVVVLYYYRLPKIPVFAYTERPNGPDVYLEYQKNNSTGLEWGENMIPIFLYRLGKRYGLNTRDELVIQVSQIEKDLL